jgi:DNA-binding PadR family transcriptional regulator
MGRKKQKLTDLIPKATPKLQKHEVDEIGDRVWQRIQAEMDKRKADLAWRSLYGDGWTVPALSEGDLQIMTAVQLLGEKATGDRILRTIEKWTEQPPILTLSLDRLEKDGLLSSTGTGDHWKRFYKPTEPGEGTLHRAKVEGRQVVAALNWRLEDEEATEGGLAEQAE